jgi:hypothetical protein
MKATTNKLALDDDARFDRLVDGEMSAEEYRALLATLDDEPGGWRRCAFAFLEAQAWRQELTAVRSAGLWQSLPGKTANQQAGARSSIDWRLVLGMAASFLVALALGIGLPNLWSSARVPVARKPGTHPAEVREPAAPASVLPRSVGSARLVFDGPSGATSEAGVLPIYEISGDPNHWLQAGESSVPASLITELERRGHRVERGQQYVPVDLEDGRRAVIPVESIQITPVSRRAY